MGHRVTSAAIVSALYRETRLSREAESRGKETDTERKAERWRERESECIKHLLCSILQCFGIQLGKDIAWVEVGVVSPPHHSQGPLWSLCSCLRTLGSGGLEAPGPKTRTQLEFHWKPSVHFRLSCQWMSRQDKGLYVMFARVTGPDDREELGLLFYRGRQEGLCLEPRRPPGVSLGVFCAQ